MMTWRLWQLLDSAFPVGGFAHSGGLEAALASGAVDGPAALERWIEGVLRQSAGASLPFARAAWRDPGALASLDEAMGERLWAGAPCRASCVQGRALAEGAARVFGGSPLLDLRDRIAGGALAGHHAPVHGAVMRHLGADEDDADRLWLFSALRGALSAAVRLGAIGPLAAQALQARLTPTLDRALADGRDRSVEQAAWREPVQELCAASHDRLRTRLFLS